MERSIYYMYKTIFSNKGQVNRCIKKICNKISVCKSDLNISNSNRGLIGGLSLECSELTLENVYSASKESNYILVVEKQSILPSVLITGSGFPSFCTRNILNNIINNSKITALYLGDYDPYGILIYLTYQSHISESSRGYFKYLGVTDSDLNLVRPLDKKPLTNYDIRMIDVITNKLENRCKIRELLLKMKEFNVKIEIEALQSIRDDFLEKYIIKRALRNYAI